MRKWAAPLALVAIVTVLTGPALAGKPTSNVSGWIAVDKGKADARIRGHELGSRPEIRRDG